MARKARKVKPHLDMWADLAAVKKHNRQLRQTISDLKWECRALRVQLYAEKTYAERYAAHYRVADSRRHSSDGSAVELDSDSGEVAA